MNITHLHNLHHQTRPPREMLRPLSGSRLGIILFPREAGLLPFGKDVFDEVLAEGGVHACGAGLVWVGFGVGGFGGGDVLRCNVLVF